MKTKTKKIVGGTVALTLVAAVVAGGTFAYLTHQTEKRVNNFTFAKSDVALNAMLTEPSWDGIIDYEYNDDGTITPVYAYTDGTDLDGNPTKVPVYGYTDGDTDKPVTDKANITSTTKRPNGTYGDEQSKSMIPGSTAGKNPKITNTGNQTDSWVAAKITFVYSTDGNGHKAGTPLNATDMAVVNDIIDVDYNSNKTTDAKWECINTSTDGTSKVFYYKETLAKDTDTTPDVYGEETEPIFTTVSVKEEATNEQIDKLNAIGGFVIYVEGFAAQSDVGIKDGAEDYDTFKAWGQAGGVVFENTPTDDNPFDVTKSIIPA